MRLMAIVSLIAAMAASVLFSGCSSASHNSALGPGTTSDKMTQAQILLSQAANTSGSTGMFALGQNFNDTSIPSGYFIWFNSGLKVSGNTTAALNGAVVVTKQHVIISLANGQQIDRLVPDAVITYAAGTATAVTTFNATDYAWETNAPAGFNDTVFLSGLPIGISDDLLTQVGLANALPGSIQNVQWQGDFYSDMPGVTFDWQWAAAVYSPKTNLVPDYNDLSVKPVNGTNNNTDQNADAAGTPENYKTLLQPGACGSGGVNWTGSYSGTASVTPCVIPVPPSDIASN